MTHLLGKAIVVTGAGRGLGDAYARCFAAMGASVVVNDIDAESSRRTAGAIEAAGGVACAFPADVAEWDEAAALIDHCVERFGAIDGLVNNAALFAMGRLDEVRRGDLDRLLAVNVTGTANCAAHALRHMQVTGSGSIVNVVSGAHMGIPAMGIYGATKGAVASLTYAWAMELAGSGVRVNAVSPMAKSPMAEIARAYQIDRGADPGRPLEIEPAANAPTVAWLLSDRSAGVNGQLVRIEKDQLALIAHPAVLLPVLDRPGGWSFEAVTEAFERDLALRQPPLGIMGIEAEGFGPPSRFWAKD